MHIGESVTSFGTLLLVDGIAGSSEGRSNPLVIGDPETNEVGLIITPKGEVRLYSQDVITRWAEAITKQMRTLNAPPSELDYITDSDPGDEHR